jgi:hypothetical protein
MLSTRSESVVVAIECLSLRVQLVCGGEVPIIKLHVEIWFWLREFKVKVEVSQILSGEVQLVVSRESPRKIIFREEDKII